MTRSLNSKGVHSFPRGISPKVNAMERLLFELTYYDVKVQQNSQFAPGNHSPILPLLFLFFFVSRLVLPVTLSIRLIFVCLFFISYFAFLY